MTLVINVTCTGLHTTKRIVLNEGDQLDIGRSNDEASLKVDARLSRKHFYIRFVDGEIEITHLSKTNPTMVAAEGSSDFQKVKGVQRLANGCRIMAGSHRFVLSVVKPDSVPPLGFSDDLGREAAATEHRSEFWSDVDPEDQPGFQSEPTLQSEASPIDQAVETSSIKSASKPRPEPSKKPTREPVPSRETPTIAAPRKKPPQPKVVFDDDDPVEKKASKKEPATKKPEVEKPIFPISDDFFDD